MILVEKGRTQLNGFFFGYYLSLSYSINRERIMLQNEFENLVKALCQLDSLPRALEQLMKNEDEEISNAAQSLSGQFSIAEVDGEKRIYHVTLQENESGVEEEFVEHVMNEDDEVIHFVAWFFFVMFDVKLKETFQAAGKTYKQPKRR